MGSIVVAEELQTGGPDWDLFGKMTAYVDGVEIDDRCCRRHDRNPDTGELVTGQVTIYDTDKVTVIGNAYYSADEYGAIGTSFYRSPTSNDGSYKEVNRYEARNADDVITQQDITVSDYTAAGTRRFIHIQRPN